MSEISSISRIGRTEPFELQVSRGQIAWHRSISVFGFNPDIDTTELVVWPNGASVAYQHPGNYVTVSSTSANDTSAGTGARTVTLEGLDENHHEVSETIALTGQTAVTSTNKFSHVNSMSVATVGSGGKNAGMVYAGTGTVTAGVPANTFNLIETGFNQSTSAHYTVPAGYTGYLVVGGISSGQATGSTAVVGKLVLIDPNQVARVVAVSALNNGINSYDFKLPIPIPEQFTVEARAYGTASNNYVAAFFQILLVKNNG